MRLENDDVFNTLYNEEFSKIPRLFRFNRKRFKIVMIIMIIFITATLTLSTLFSETRTGANFETASGYSIYYDKFNFAYLIAMLITALIVALLAGWMTISYLYEKRAFAKASKLANMIYLSERHKAEIDHQNWKMHNPY